MSSMSDGTTLAKRRFLTWAEARRIACTGTPVRHETWTEGNAGILWPVKTVTSHSTTTNLFSLTGHGYAEGDEVLFSCSAEPPVAEYDRGGGFRQDAYITGEVTRVRAVLPNTFGLRADAAMIFPIALTVAGSGTLRVQRQTRRLWLQWQRGWWRWDGKLWKLARAHDVTAAEYGSALWTTMTEEEILASGNSAWVRTPSIVPGYSGSSSGSSSGVSSSGSGSGASGGTDGAAAADVSVLSTAPVLGGGSAGGADSSGGGGGGSGGGSSIQGGGNAGGGGKGGPGIGNGNAGTGGGGGGSGGGAGGGGDGGGDSTTALDPWSPSISAELGYFGEVILAPWSGSSNSVARTMKWSVSLSAEPPPDTARFTPGLLYYVHVTVGLVTVFSGFMSPGSTQEGLHAFLFTPGGACRLRASVAGSGLMRGLKWAFDEMIAPVRETGAAAYPGGDPYCVRGYHYDSESGVCVPDV